MDLDFCIDLSSTNDGVSLFCAYRQNGLLLDTTPTSSLVAFPTDVMGRKGHRNSTWVGLVIVYTGLILVVWFTFSSHSFAWVPYKFYPFIWAFY